ncbi:MAG: sigma-70 family RNA polymerase sigma factor [Bacteroidales bacterium]|nr:sigma-70 family RNA polymerase sigma factor [Bacteroidales bacterium]
MSDKEKLERYDKLIANHKGLIVKVCQTYCRYDYEAARDLYQDIVLEIWTHIDKFKKESSEATWIWHLAVNTAIDKLRKEQRRPVLVLGTPLPERGTEERPRRIDDLYEAIAHLNTDDQMLVNARLEDYSYEEIAKETGVSEGALRVRYNRVVKQLRQIMKGK